MFDGNDEAKRDDGRGAASSGSVRRRRFSAVEKAAVIRETREPGARVSEIARRLRWIRSRFTGGGTVTV
jgi:transposase-like protein